MAECNKDFQEIWLDSFTYEDAWRLGTLMKQMAEEQGLHIVISIEKSNQVVFQCALEGTSPDNDRWIAGKRRIVNLTYKSSLEVTYSLNGEPIESLGLDSADFLAKGGGVPVFVNGVGYVGNVIVSGLAHTEDHAFAVDGLKKFAGL